MIDNCSLTYLSSIILYQKDSEVGLDLSFDKATQKYSCEFEKQLIIVMEYYEVLYPCLLGKIRLLFLSGLDNACTGRKKAHE